MGYKCFSTLKQSITQETTLGLGHLSAWEPAGLVNQSKVNLFPQLTDWLTQLINPLKQHRS